MNRAAERQDDRDLFSGIDGGIPRSLYHDFQDFHRDNPNIYKLFKMYTLEAVEAGMKKVGAKFVIERVRWEVFVITKTGDGFKINNNHTAFYARLFMKDHPQYEGLFETRTAAADSA